MLLIGRLKSCSPRDVALFYMFFWTYMINDISLVRAEVFTVGYLTGSQRRPGSFEYERPGLTISGAITMAFGEVNEQKLKKLGHRLEFIVAETFGEEISSIKQTANLWIRNVSAIFGPQETCLHEGRMAAAFNIPMISYFCTNQETSNKKHYPTFARTRPPDIQISKSVVSLLLGFNWKKVTFLYLESEELERYMAIAKTLMKTLEQAGIEVLRVRKWKEVFHIGYMKNPFDDIVEQTFMNTRIYVILGQQFEHIGLLSSLKRKGLLENGEYFVIGVDIEQYDPKAPEKYLKGVLQNSLDKEIVDAFRSYIAVLPSPSIGFENFSSVVNHYLEMHPFYYKNPLVRVGGSKLIRAEAAYLYDAVHLYADALIEVLRKKQDPTDGKIIFNALKNRRYMSAMGYMVSIDENGDAEGNYTILQSRGSNNQSHSNIHGLYPIGTFKTKNDTVLPVIQLYKNMDWIKGIPPVAEPACGFNGEKCLSYTGEITAGAAGLCLLILLAVSTVFYRNWKYEQELDNLLWKIDFKDITVPEAEKKGKQEDGETQTLYPLLRTSQASLSSNPDADFRYSSIFTEVGIYRGQLYAVKKINKRKNIDITRGMKMELKMLRDMRHDNLNAFIGASIDSPNICIISEYCNRGSLKDILENEDVKLDNMFIASMVADILRGMIHLHESPIRFHGALCPSNCLIDARWVVKISDFGLHYLKYWSDNSEEFGMDKKLETSESTKLLYRSPEVLRVGLHSSVPGSQKGDSYSFGIILYEMCTRRGPFGEMDCSIYECLTQIINPIDYDKPLRPSLQPLDTSFDCVRACVCECWAENPESRPDFKLIRSKLRALRKGMKSNIFDNMMAMMEKYANNLEQLVDERTDQLQEEKKKTDALLLEMLPKPVAEQLKKGQKVEAESYDCVTIYFSDIVGFTAMAAESTPLQVVEFLNDLYTCFDSIIGNYDVYKVETIGDAYMVVSGLPIRNGDLHVGEIASMALELLKAMEIYRIAHQTNEPLKLRIGIHSGPVCAGVVGLKMPRYCLFGDTVNTASRMESTGDALKIHCSKSCKEMLCRIGGYFIEPRGVISIKGKGEQETFWLTGEDKVCSEQRNLKRKERRGSKLTNKSTIRSCNAVISQKSSLKNRGTLKRPSIPRSTSLESPKKLRFASELLLENHQYQIAKEHNCLDVSSTDHLSKTYSRSLHSDDLASSCPCIDGLCVEAQKCAMKPLLLVSNSSE